MFSAVLREVKRAFGGGIAEWWRKRAEARSERERQMEAKRRAWKESRAKMNAWLAEHEDTVNFHHHWEGGWVGGVSYKWETRDQAWHVHEYGDYDHRHAGGGTVGRAILTTDARHVIAQEKLALGMDDREHAARLLGSVADWMDDNGASHGVGSQQIAELALAATLLRGHARYHDCHFDAERALFRAGSLLIKEPLGCFLALNNAYNALVEASNTDNPKSMKVGAPLYPYLRELVAKARKGAGMMIENLDE